MDLNKYYFKSKDIKVFPSSFRGTYAGGTFDPESRLNTEANFIAPKRTSNKTSYIVDYSETTIKFVLGGYYFEIYNLSSYTTDSTESINLLYGTTLGIKLREISLTNDSNTSDPDRKTKVLTDWEETTDYILDKVEDGISYFIGLKVLTETKGYDATIQLFDVNGNINQEALLVDLDHGTGENTLIHGVGLKAGTINQTVFGTYNDNKADTLFEVGSGTNAANRNALEVSATTTTINTATNINGDTIITGSTKIEGTTEITDTTEVQGDLIISKDTESESTTTGALKVAGGVGISKNLNVDGNTNLDNILVVKASPEESETNVEIKGTLNVTGLTNINNSVDIGLLKINLNKPVKVNPPSPIYDFYNALTVEGKTIIKKDLEVGSDTKVLTVKTNTGEQNVTVTGTLKSTDKATFENGLEVASGKTTTLGGQVDITGAVNINTNSTENPGDITIHGDTTVNGDTSITGATNLNGDLTVTNKTTLGGQLEVNGNVDINARTNITGAVNINTDNQSSPGAVTIYGDTTINSNLTVADGKTTTLGGDLAVAGKATSEPTEDADEDRTLTTKGYVDRKFDRLDFTATSDETVAEASTGNYIQSVTQTDGKVTTTKYSFDTTFNPSSNNAPASSAVESRIDTKIGELNVPSVGTDGSYLKTVSETGGKITANKQAFDTVIGSSPSNTNAPTSNAVKSYVDSKLVVTSHIQAVGVSSEEYDDAQNKQIFAWTKPGESRDTGVTKINNSKWQLCQGTNSIDCSWNNIECKAAKLPSDAAKGAKGYWFGSTIFPISVSTTSNGSNSNSLTSEGVFGLGLWIRFVDDSGKIKDWDTDDASIRINLISLIKNRLKLEKNGNQAKFSDINVQNIKILSYNLSNIEWTTTSYINEQATLWAEPFGNNTHFLYIQSTSDTDKMLGWHIYVTLSAKLSATTINTSSSDRVEAEKEEDSIR